MRVLSPVSRTLSTAERRRRAQGICHEGVAKVGKGRTSGKGFRASGDGRNLPALLQGPWLEQVCDQDRWPGAETGEEGETARAGRRRAVRVVSKPLCYWGHVWVLVMVTSEVISKMSEPGTPAPEYGISKCPPISTLFAPFHPLHTN